MIEGELVVLRPYEARDLGFFTSLRNDFQTQIALMAQPRPHTAAKANEWLTARAESKDTIFFVVAPKATNEACGFVELRNVEQLHQRAELGISLAPASRGKGYALESLTLIEDYARNVFNIRKIVLHVKADNAPAVGLYHNAGYRTVGTHHEHFYHNGSFHDVIVMEKLLQPRTTS